MFEFFSKMFSTEFMPHGHCFFWRPEILYLHVFSDALIAFSYYSIPLALITIVRRRDDLEFDKMFVLFALFIFACGTTHLMGIWTMWTPIYRLEGIVKLLTALVSATTAVLLWPLIPKILGFPSVRQLQKEVEVRKATQQALEVAQQELEERVADRTAALSQANRDLARQAELLDYSPDAFLGLSKQGVITTWNQGAEELFATSFANVSDRDFLQYFSPDTRAHLQQRLQAADRGEKTRMLEATLITRDQAELAVSIGIGAAKLHEEDVTEICVSIRDISERKRFEQVLQESENRHRAIINAALDAIISIDEHGRIQTWNESATRLYGRSADAVVGQDITDLLGRTWEGDGATADNEDARSRVLRHRLEVLFKNGNGELPRSRFETESMRADGTEFPVEVAIAPIESQGQTLHVGFIQDITKRKAAERLVEEQSAELARSNKELEQFAYIASHDLKEPLRQVATFSTLVKERASDRLTGEEIEYLHFAIDGAERMQQLVNDLLSYSLVRRDPTKAASCDAQEVLSLVLQDLMIPIQSNGATVRSEQLPVVPVDQTQFRQLLSNLLGNALKYKSDRPPEIRISVQEQEAHWLFAVTDNGIGFKPAYAERIFEMFRRLHSRSKYPGTGLGLALCRRIVEQHGGRIWAEGEEDKGSTFFFTLPKTK